MAQFSVRVEGDQQVRVGLNKFADTLAPICRADVKDAMDRAVAKSPGYLGGTSYTTPEAGYARTGNLGRSVTIEQNGLTTTIKNDAYSTRGFNYGPLVLGMGDGSGQKETYARNGWPTLRSAVDAEVDKLAGNGGTLDKALGDSAKAAGL